MALVVMGVAGSGKSTIGQAIAAELQADFIEGDRFHPPGNIAKMAAGTPLNDQDREPWLAAIGAEMAAVAAEGRSVVAACSSLRRQYRNLLRNASGRDLTFIMLEGSRTLISSRMAAREGHFMPMSLLDSQFSTLEPLQPDEQAVLADLDQPIHAILGQIMAGLGQCHSK